MSRFLNKESCHARVIVQFIFWKSLLLRKWQGITGGTVLARHSKIAETGPSE